MKYAVVETGGKQYVAREGETIEVDRLSTEVGKSITFKEVLLAVDNGTVTVGSPYVKDAAVKGTILAEVKAAKIIVFKYIPKERYRRRKGHRQRYSRVLIDSVDLPSTGKKDEPKAVETKSKAAATKKATEKSKPTTKKASPVKPAAKKKTETAATTKSKAKTAKPKKATEKSKTKASTTKSKSTSKQSSTKKSTPKKSSSKSGSKSSSSKTTDKK